MWHLNQFVSARKHAVFYDRISVLVHHVVFNSLHHREIFISMGFAIVAAVSPTDKSKELSLILVFAMGVHSVDCTGNQFQIVFTSLLYNRLMCRATDMMY